MSQRKFAYGRDKVGGCKCPASTAGYDPSSGEESTVVAEQYDEILYSNEIFKKHQDDRIINEEKAKEAWLQAVERTAQYYGENSNFHQVAVNIAEELGWM